ncbi:helix-hairpin-helix domain-containing protein [Paraflavitalea soli]|uniref:Helix-hairpin-helix domain-containing protein n=1 Tax=Paraflavitalea soli TaxID=2315862 RepID=A0A3B7MTI6_9BACT|nr:helix-hairpin-helix domain-containing protein [Paraflavitalea soli]AXY77428.1 helix-hairpin-helix domain-containing protein [Paraflavitalea soli]
MKNNFREYFNFTKKERTGIIVLLVLILATIIIPYLLPAPAVQTDKAAFEKLRQRVAALETGEPDGENDQPGNDVRIAETPAKQTTFYVFDPNTLPVEGWIKMGIRERTAQTIQHYLAKGGRFRQPGDLYKVYGLKKEEAERLVPYVRIKEAAPVVERAPAIYAADSAARRYKREVYAKPAVIDINMADTTAFIALRGIGSKLARRIVHFREKLGGFYAVAQVGETYGLPDSTFQQIRQYLQCSSPAVRTLNINSADIDMLRQHPYIRWALANGIVQYRAQHGAYQSVDQLLQINIVSAEILEKIRPYLAVE